MRVFLIIVFIIINFSCARSQTLIRGMIVDSASFNSIPNANIIVKHKLQGTVTDSRGNFTINATEKDTLVISFVGYRTLKLSLYDYEPGMIRLTQKEIVLAPVDIYDNRMYLNPYEGLFNEQNEKLKKRIPFYYAKVRKDKIKAGRWREESARVQTYVNVVITSPDLRNEIMKTYQISEKEYYDLLTSFNESHYHEMYYLTEPELKSLLRKFFEAKVK